MIKNNLPVTNIEINKITKTIGIVIEIALTFSPFLMGGLLPPVGTMKRI